MRLYRDRPDVLTEGRWRWCPEGAEALPFPHAFSPRIYDIAGFHLPDDAVGEVEWIGKCRGDDDPRYTGRHHCGTADQFLNGSLFAERGSLPVDAEGVPLCCGVAPPVGGLGLGGEGAASSWTDLAVWLRPAELADYGAGETLTSWPAAPLTPVSAAPLPGVPPAVEVDATTGIRGALLTVPPLGVPVGLSLSSVVDLPGDFAVFVVARVGAGPGQGGPIVSGQGGSTLLPAVVYDTVFAQPFTGGTSALDPIAPGSLHVWLVQRSGTTATIWRDGALLATWEPGSQACSLDRLTGSTRSAVLAGWTLLFELRVWPRGLSVSEGTAEWQYLMDSYGDHDMPPTGALIDMAMPTPIDGYLLCDGAAYEITAFPALAGYLGGIYDTHRGAAAPPAGQFRVPDFRGLVGVCGGSESENPATSAYAEGQTWGEEAHQLVTAELAAHLHAITDPTHAHDLIYGSANYTNAGPDTIANLLLPPGRPVPPVLVTAAKLTGVSVQTAGGDVAHETRQPSAAVFRFIKT